MLSSDVSVGNQILASQYNDLRSDAASLVVGASTEATIASGVFALVAGQSFYRVDTEGDGAADDLTNISGGSEGNIVVLVAEDVTRVVTIKDGANILLGDDEDLDLDTVTQAIVLIKTAAGPWKELSRTIPTTGGFDSDLICLFDDDCPSGWTRFDALDGKYPRGADSYGGTGGAATHDHEVLEVPAHTHSANTLAGDSAGAHIHEFRLDNDNIGSGDYSHSKFTTTWIYTFCDYAGSHTHSITGTTGAFGEGAAPSTSVDNGEPPYLEMIFCKKD